MFFKLRSSVRIMTSTLVGRWCTYFILLTCLEIGLVNAQQCDLSPLTYADSQTTFRVGVLAIRGNETAWSEFGPTFSTYLTYRVGRVFDPPVRFEVRPLAFTPILDGAVSGDYDFVFANPSIFSCLESEVGATSLVSMVALRKVNGQEYKLNKFGGVIFTLAGNDEIQDISDLRNKTIATASISGLGSGQMQFREMQRNGLHHLQDPRQLIFMGNQDKVVNAVLTGMVDVGFVRTDQLERSTDPTTNEALSLDRVKIISIKEGLESSGGAFPFRASTNLYPEWNLGALQHVNHLVSQEVQKALLELSDHATVAGALNECYDVANCTGAEDHDLCKQKCFQNLTQETFRHCDTTPDLAILADNARKAGGYERWETTLSYMELRNMQEETGFIDLTGEQPKCIRGAELVDSINCPKGFFKKPDSEISNGCEQKGIPCYGYQCICSPCLKAYDVDVFPADSEIIAGCSKFAVCGTVKQHDRITFFAVDNKKRENANFTAKILVGKKEEMYDLLPVDSAILTNYSYTFTIDATKRETGVMIIDVFVDGEQIPESPFRLQVEPRDCHKATGDLLREPDSLGACVCSSGSLDLGRRCVKLSAFLSYTIIPFLVVCSVLSMWYVSYKKKQADTLWVVEPKELIFHDPPRTLGRGTFGLVLLAEYRGTQVAVKRVLPPQGRVVERHQTTDLKTHPIFGILEAPNGTSSVSSATKEPTNKQYKGKGKKNVTFGGEQLCSLNEVRKRSVSEGRPSYFDFNDTNRNIQMSSSGRSSSAFGGHNHGIGLKSGFIPRSFGSSGDRSSRFFATRNSKSADKAQMQKDFIKEMRYISRLRHPCITTILGAVIDRKSEPMLVMEYMTFGSLYDLLHNNSMVLDGESLLPVLRDIAQGLRFLHAAEPQVVHGDLKSHNILVDSNFRAKVADFGFSQKRIFRKSVATGTPFWMAPELLQGKTANTAASDVYSFGIVLFEVFSRSEPYEGEDAVEVLRAVADEHIQKRPPIPSTCPPEVAKIMKACFKHDPALRPTSEDIDVQMKMLDSENIDPVECLVPRRKRNSEEAARVDGLLYSMFPRRIADELKAGRKIEAEHYECCTVLFSDIVGFTQLAGILTPEKVSSLLNRLYSKIDNLCEVHHVYKVETAGDAYMAITNLELQQPEHVRIMANFALDMMEAADSTLIDIDNPEMGRVRLRIGFHAGPVVAHVVGSKKPRFSVIGDTVNVAARMEQLSEPGRIQTTELCAQMLREQAPDLDLQYRGEIVAKGKGELLAYFVSSFHNSTASTAEDSVPDSSDGISTLAMNQKMIDRLIDWNFGILKRLLQQIVAHRIAKSGGNAKGDKETDRQGDIFVKSESAIDEVVEVIEMPSLNHRLSTEMKGYDKIKLSNEIQSELRSYISIIARMYKNNSFHSFEHASTVAMNVSKLLGRVVVPEHAEDAHKYSHGIGSDPLTQFAVVFSAMIHDTDHSGVPNSVLCAENTPIAVRYNGKSVAEQNSIDIAWELLMDDQYSNLRGAIYGTPKEFQRFRQLVVNTVLATDIVDKELKALRNKRWEKAFGKQAQEEDYRVCENRKATIVIEHMIQAADVGHTMQNWSIYRRWNERFFRECYKAFLDGRVESDPSQGWYQGEMGFFDFYIIPLARKLQECGVFGTSGDENLNYAIRNKQLWEERGQEIVAEMIENFHTKGG